MPDFLAGSFANEHPAREISRITEQMFIIASTVSRQAKVGLASGK